MNRLYWGKQPTEGNAKKQGLTPYKIADKIKCTDYTNGDATPNYTRTSSNFSYADVLIQKETLTNYVELCLI